MSLSSKRKWVLLCFSLLLLNGCDNAEEKTSRYKKKGTALFEQGLLEKARLEFKNAARLAPTDAEITYQLGLIEEETGNLKDALGLFAYAEQQNPTFHPALLKRAHYEIASERYGEAHKHIETVLKEDSENAQAHALLAALALRAQKGEEAEKEARFALSQDASNITAFAALAGLYASHKDAEKTFSLLEEGIQKNPKEPSLLLLKALMGDLFSDFGKIEEAYHALFILKPTEPRYRTALADLYLKAGHKDKAEETLWKATQATPENWPLKHRYIAFLYQTKGLEAAEAMIIGYQKENPEKRDLDFWLADLYVADKNTERAIQLLEKIVRENKADEIGLNAETFLARLNLAKGNWESAEKLAKIILEKHSGNPDALFVLANKDVINGNYAQAVSALRTILRNAPKHKDTIVLLAEAFLLQNRVDLAIDTLQQLKTLDPANAHVAIRLAQMYYINGSSAYALQLLNALAKTKPSEPVVWESIARITIEGKSWEKAEEALAALQSLPNQTNVVAFLKGQMAFQKGTPSEAIAFYQQIIEQAPAAPLAERSMEALLDVATQAKKLEETALFLAGLSSPTSFSMSVLGETYARLQNNEKAAVAFEQAMTNPMAGPYPYMGRARLFLQEQKYKEALDILSQAEEKDPASLKVSLMKASILERQENYEEALKIYESILLKKHDFKAAANNLALILANHFYNNPQEMERARRIAEGLRDSSNPHFIDTLAWIQYRSGYFEQARSLFETLMHQNKALPPEVYYHYGATLVKLGETKQAKEMLLRAATGKPSYVGLKEAQKLLADLER